MAVGNKGFGLYNYARIIFDPTHQFIFMQYARKYLKNSLVAKDVYPDANDAFRHTNNQIESAYPIEQLDDFKEYKNYYKHVSKKEIEYRQWSSKNRLFINPLNDVIS